MGRVGKDSLGFEIASSKKHATEDQAWKAQSVTAGFFLFFFFESLNMFVCIMVVGW